MLVALICIQCLIIFLLFEIYKKISNKSNNTFSEKTIESSNTYSEKDFKSKKEFEIFVMGIQQSWLYVNICLYKMYRDLDILDFDSIQSKLEETVNELSKDPNRMKEWNDKLIEYLDEKK